MPYTPKLTDAELALEDRIAWLTLQRDDVRNALTGTALIDDIEVTARWVNRHEDVSVLNLTGAGRAFSAGGDIKDMAGRGDDLAGRATRRGRFGDLPDHQDHPDRSRLPAPGFRVAPLCRGGILPGERVSLSVASINV